MINRRLVEDFFSREISFKGIRRELEVKPLLNKIISIVGPRRSGKTWFFFYLFERVDDPLYVNLEDVAFRGIRPGEFFDVIKIFSEMMYRPKTVLLDEVQSMEGWEALARSLQDRGFRLFITGSSSKLLPKEVSTELRGRSLTYLLLPFSFREFVRAKRVDVKTMSYENVGQILKNLREYLEFGGFPEVVMTEQKDRVLKEYFDEIFYRDFVERHGIKSLDFGRFLFEFAIQNFSKEMSARRIKSFFEKRISYTTLYSYIDKLQDTLIVFFLDRFSESVYTRRSWPKKLYLCDVGIPRIFRFTEKVGDKMENLVFLELLRRRNESPLLEVFYFKDWQGREVDFVVKEGVKVKQLIQVTFVSAKDEVERREVRSLVMASELLKCKDLFVITWDYEDDWDVGGARIKFIPLWKWLLKR